MAIIAAVYIIMVPITIHFLPQRSDKRGMKVAEKVHPVKKDMPIKAIVDLDAPMHIYYIENYYIRDLSACTNSAETKDRSIQFCDKYPSFRENQAIFLINMVRINSYQCNHLYMSISTQGLILEMQLVEKQIH